MALELKYYVIVLALLLPLYWGVLRTAARRVLFLGVASLAVISLWVGVSFGARAGLLLAAWLPLQCLVIFGLGSLLRSNQGGFRIILACLLPVGTLVAGKHLLMDRYDTGFPAWIFLTVGISYYTLKNIHYLVESGRGRFADLSFAGFFAYITFFPMFTAGPIERLDRFSADAGELKLSGEQFSRGLERIVVGLGKKFVLADMVLAGCLAPGALTIGGAPNISWGQLTIAAFFRFLFIYVEFSGYTDLVIGTGRLFGFELMENFRFPLLRPNLAEFWRSWHISLSSWVRDYIYFPLLAGLRSPTLGIVAAMVTMGLWHDVRPGWILWGVHHGTGLAVLSHAQRMAGRSVALQRVRGSLPWRMLGMVAVWWFVSVGHALTLHPGSWHNSLSLYLKLISGGHFG